MKLFEKILREHSYDGMTVKEFYDKFSSLDLEDKDYGEGVPLFFQVHYAGNYSGTPRVLDKIDGDTYVLSNRFDPNDDDDFSPKGLLHALEKIIEDGDGDCELAFDCPSMGTYAILDVERVHNDYSYDGDGIYDTIDIQCSED